MLHSGIRAVGLSGQVVESVWFLTSGEEEEADFLSTRELKELLEKEAQVFVLFAVLSTKSQTVIDEL